MLTINGKTYEVTPFTEAQWDTLRQCAYDSAVLHYEPLYYKELYAKLEGLPENIKEAMMREAVSKPFVPTKEQKHVVISQSDFIAYMAEMATGVDMTGIVNKDNKHDVLRQINASQTTMSGDEAAAYLKAVREQCPESQ